MKFISKKIIVLSVFVTSLAYTSDDNKDALMGLAVLGGVGIVTGYVGYCIKKKLDRDELRFAKDEEALMSKVRETMEGINKLRSKRKELYNEINEKIKGLREDKAELVDTVEKVGATLIQLKKEMKYSKKEYGYEQKIYDTLNDLIARCKASVKFSNK